MDAIGTVIHLMIWLFVFTMVVVFGPPVILVWTSLDRSKPYWPVVRRRYWSAIRGCLEAI